MDKRIALTAGLASWAFLMSVSLTAEEGKKARIYADPKGRFSFELSGDWIKLRTNGDNGVIGSFLLTKKVSGSRTVVAELMISSAVLKIPISLEEYVRAEDTRVMNTPGFRRIGRQEKVTLGGEPALRNRYALTREARPGARRHELVHQYYVLREGTVWGITFSAPQQDESILAEVERGVVSSFQFSVPADAEKISLDVFKKVTVAGAKGGFSVAFPEAWEVSQSEEDGATFRGPDAVVYAFSLPREQENESPEDLAGNFLKQRENLKELQVLSQGVEDVASLKGYVVEYSGVGEGRRWRVRLAVFLYDKKVFFVHCVSPEERWQANGEVFGRIVQSLSVAAPEETAGDNN